MKVRSVKYLAGEGIKSMWANRLMTIASIGVLVACMVLMGLAVLITMNVDKALGTLEQQNVIMAFFNDEISVRYGSASVDYDKLEQDTSSTSNENEENKTDAIPEDAYLIHNEEEALALCDKIEKDIDNVIKVEYFSSEDALKIAKDRYLEGQEGTAAYLDGSGNPLSCGAKITLSDMSLYNETLTSLSKIKGIDSLQSHAKLADTITAIKEGIAVAGFWIIAILLIISLVIVSNTIRVTMYSRKLEISIMKAVGATKSFIRLPFIIEGMTIGLVSAGLSMGIVYFCYRVATESIKNNGTFGMMEVIGFSSVWHLVLGIFVAIGILAGVLGSAIMISKYLKKEGSEFAAI
ncbi:MAG: ABC transporter permease [Clostridia bacterium]|nr:ABC transporter permease [Clostridia bacterium]